MRPVDLNQDLGTSATASTVIASLEEEEKRKEHIYNRDSYRSLKEKVFAKDMYATSIFREFLEITSRLYILTKGSFKEKQESHIVEKGETPNICGGSARIKGTRIRVSDVIRWIRGGFSKEEIAKELRIDVKAVEDALIYYNKHKEEIDSEIEEEENINIENDR